MVSDNGKPQNGHKVFVISLHCDKLNNHIGRMFELRIFEILHDILTLPGQECLFYSTFSLSQGEKK